jgi:hypothetical protein
LAVNPQSVKRLYVLIKLSLSALVREWHSPLALGMYSFDFPLSDVALTSSTAGQRSSQHASNISTPLSMPYKPTSLMQTV